MASRPGRDLPKPERLQLNLRLPDRAVLSKIEALRGNRRPLPTTSRLILDLINEAYDREIGPPLKRRN